MPALTTAFFSFCCVQGLMSPLSAVRSPVHITLPVVQEGPLTTSITVAVPDERIGAIVGRAGKTITEIQQVSVLDRLLDSFLTPGISAVAVTCRRTWRLLTLF